MQTHENVSSFRKVVLGSNRKFGLSLGFILAALGAWPLVHHHSPRWGFLTSAALIAAFALAAPDWLAPLNRAWFRLGLLLNRIVSPVIMGLMFFLAVTPLGWAIRKMGVDLLNLKVKPEVDSYWTLRAAPPPGQGGMTKQF